jgi:putative phosphoribosyl transferase
MSGNRVFRDRADAGRALASAVKRWALSRPLVLGLPRGGVPVAFEVAQAIGADLDVLVVRKLGVPYQPELAFGAIASGGVCVFNEDVLRSVRQLDDETIERIITRESAELVRRESAFRGARPYPTFTNRDVLLIDDGLATGATMCAAVRAVKHGDARRVLVAVPTGSGEAVKRILHEADDVICLDTPVYFSAVGSQYERFDQTSDQEVRRILDRAWIGESAKSGEEYGKH